VRQFGTFAPDWSGRNLTLPFDFTRPVAIRLLVVLRKWLKLARKRLRPFDFFAQHSSIRERVTTQVASSVASLHDTRQESFHSFIRSNLGNHPKAANDNHLNLKSGQRGLIQDIDPDAGHTLRQREQCIMKGRPCRTSISRYCGYERSPSMDSRKYIGMDVHQASISAAIRDANGKLVMESIFETKAATILEFIQGLHGSLWVAFEEGTGAGWLYDLLKPHVAKVIVCDPRKNALPKRRSKNDCVDARTLSELLRAGLLSPVYHAGTSVRTLKELARSYLTLTRDVTRVMNRLKALHRNWGIRCTGRAIYARSHRSDWLEKLPEAGVRRRAERLYQELDYLQPLRQEARKELLAESRKHPACELLREVPSLGPIRTALVIALIQTPHRFRTKRQLWTYSGLALNTQVSGEYSFTDGELQRARKHPVPRGLNDNHNHDLKNVFKGAAATAATALGGPLQDFYAALLAKGMRPAMARLTLARKIAAITLSIWKKGERFDTKHLKPQAA
jgi:transposase